MIVKTKESFFLMIDKVEVESDDDNVCDADDEGVITPQWCDSNNTGGYGVKDGCSCDNNEWCVFWEQKGGGYTYVTCLCVKDKSREWMR